MPFKAIIHPIQDDFSKVNKLIDEQCFSRAALVNTLSHAIFNVGGKRLRPLVLLLSARACGYAGADHIALATVIEYIHTATLLHDDVVDKSPLRRGKPAAHTQWGNEAAVLVGDFLYSRAFQLMTQIDDLRVMRLLANTTNVLAEGEALQLLNCHNPHVSEEEYLEIIQAKTAKLFETAAQLGALLAHAPPDIEAALAQYGLHLGTAFQIMDDLLDYQGTEDEMGKTGLHDLHEGKVTLPLIYLYNQGTADQKALLETVILQEHTLDLTAIQTLIKTSGALQYTHQVAQNHIDRALSALSALPPSPFKTSATSLALFAIQRTY